MDDEGIRRKSTGRAADPGSGDPQDFAATKPTLLNTTEPLRPDTGHQEPPAPERAAPAGGVKIDPKDFFINFTLKICGSLDITKALHDCLLYISRIMPVDQLALTLYNREAGAMEFFEMVTDEGDVRLSEKDYLPPDLITEIEQAELEPRVRVAADVYDDPILRRIATILKWGHCSALIGRLIIEGKYIGAITVRASGIGRYTDEHVLLWTLINEPVAIALANARQHRDVLKLKDLLLDDKKYLQNELRREASVEVVGADFGLREVMENVRRVAPLTSPVLLEGETGTGKEVIANAIHNLSSRADGPFITVNCGAIPDTLIDSELFGHEKGAFTGALTQKRGRFERAHGGTIFLDEVGEFPLLAQVRLLRVIQEKEFERVGGTSPVKVDVRVISATNRNLENLVESGDFRQDLYFRLKVFPITLPPLRDRKDDIPALVQHFLHKKSREMVLHKLPALAPGALETLMAHDWPGNVRELENAIERAIIISGGRPLEFDTILGVKPADRSGQSADGSIVLKDVEGRLYREALAKADGRIEGKGGAAELLGIKPGALRHRLRKLKIEFGRKAP
jgi:transcriptional regulator with GAF, ATPase, and Fis domain